jgi:hypothetical protein
MENDYIKIKGTIQFDPVNYTRKHQKQSSWKKIAIVKLDGDLCQYYSWLVYKRYGLKLNKPIRNAHISFINDSKRDIAKGLDVDEKIVDVLWENFKNKWDNKEIDIYLNPDIRSNSEHWWLNVPEEKRKELHDIRKEIGLDRPFYGLHMTVGYIDNKNIEHSKYITDLLVKFGKEYN